jgi:hypothetical protein
VVELQADALGVTKRHRVVARSPWSLLRSSHDLGTELLKERIQLVDVLARAGAEAEVVNAGCEFLVRMLEEIRVRPTDSERRAAADVVDVAVRAKDRFQSGP